jgi:hydrogenase maturation protease
VSDCLAPGSSVLVIGLGNILQGDDGFGVRVVQRLQERLAEIDTTARIVDGGTAGLGLLPYLEAESRVLFIDAIDVGEAPGALLRIDRAMDLALPGSRRQSIECSIS